MKRLVVALMLAGALVSSCGKAEEHDAALLGSGDLIAQYTVDLSTGAVEKL